MYHFDRWLIVD